MIYSAFGRGEIRLLRSQVVFDLDDSITKTLSNLTRRAPQHGSLLVHFVHCGWGEIRTHGPLARTTVFKTVPLDHSGTHPIAR